MFSVEWELRRRIERTGISGNRPVHWPMLIWTSSLTSVSMNPVNSPSWSWVLPVHDPEADMSDGGNLWRVRHRCIPIGPHWLHPLVLRSRAAGYCGNNNRMFISPSLWTISCYTTQENRKGHFHHISSHNEENRTLKCCYNKDKKYE